MSQFSRNSAVVVLERWTTWPVAFALTELTKADEAKVGKLVKKAVA